MLTIVPWRLHVPGEAFEPLFGEDGSEIKKFASSSGSRIDVEASGALAAAWGGAVLTIHGTMWQKRTASSQLLGRLFALQGVDRAGAGRLAIVLPALACGTVASAEVIESVELIGAKIQVDAAGSEGPPRVLARLEGSAQQAYDII